MRLFAYIMLSLAAFVLILATLNGDSGNAMRSTSLEIVAAPEAAAQLEAQRQAHAQDMAEIQARLESERMEAHTLRLALLLLFVLLVALGSAVLWGALAMSGRRNTYVLLPGSPGFSAALTENGGYWHDGSPMIDGRIVKRLEVIDD